MAKTLRKRQAKQHARIKDWTETCARLEAVKSGSSRGYRKPGSMTK